MASDALQLRQFPGTVISLQMSPCLQSNAYYLPSPHVYCLLHVTCHQ